MARHGIYPRDIIPPISDYFASGRFGRLFASFRPSPPTRRLRAQR